MQLGMVGLGRMGGEMARRLIKKGHDCVVFDLSPKVMGELVKENAIGSTSLSDLVPHLEAGDILIDGGNSYYVDDIRRAQELAAKRIHYVDVGTSGGVWG